MRKDGDHCPDERDETEQDVSGSEEIILEGELEVGEGEVEDEVQCKRQCGRKRQFSLHRHQEYLPERNGDEYVEHRPHRTEHPNRRRPYGLD